MGTIVQTNPTSDSVAIGNSDAYSTQLQAAGAVAPVTWTTTVFNSGLEVSPGGIVSTVSSLALGPYTVSGTMADSGSNTGIWSFTLTVKDLVAPQTSVTPTLPGASTGVELLVPFQVDPATGGMAVQPNYNAIIAQHLLSILMTAPGERVMMPTYGFGAEAKVFEPLYVRTPSILQPDIVQQLQAYEPDVQIQSVVVEPDPNYPNVLDITISYSVIPSNTSGQVTVAIGGSQSQVVSP